MSSASDFSLFSLFTAGLACLIPLANAYTKPVGAEPKGNPIYQPGLNSIVPVGENFTVTWDPTTPGTVTLVLLKGPSTNAVPQYAIVEKIYNSGSYVWSPSNDLAPGDTGYGIQLIDDTNGQYQYTTQFGISNPDYSPSFASSSRSSKSATASVTASVTATKSSTKSVSASVTAAETASANDATTASIYYTTEVVSKFTTYCPYATSLTIANHTYTVSSATTLTVIDCPCTITKPYTTGSATVGPISTSVVVSTGGMPANSSIVYPTGSMTVPSSLTARASASSGAANATGSSTAPIQTGAAGEMATSFVGLVVAAGVAVFAL